MRKKLYYSVSETTNNLYTRGGEWALPGNVEYIGLYHRYTTGEVYTEPQWDSNKSKPLTPYETTSQLKQEYKKLTQLSVNKNSPTEYFVKINATDIKNRFITRYFLKKINSTEIIEVNESTYKHWQTDKIDNNLYVGVSMKWQITGNVSDVIRFNNSEIISVKSKITNIQTKLPDLLQFYADTSIVIPRDINGLDS